MLSGTAMYAAKKRKKPVQKTPKPPPLNGTKSNPSKRHRDRLNGELDKLTSLLPFSDEVRARLDKLSVLRLSVGYLKVKSFFNATMKAGQSSSSWASGRSLAFGGTSQPPPSTPSAPTAVSIDGVSFSEGDLLLQALNGFVLVVTAEGYIFYTSPTILDFLGFHQSDVVHQSVFELIHTEDRALFRRQLHFSLNPNPEGSSSPSGQSSAEISTNIMAYDPHAIPPENSSFLERNFCCRFRCLLDNSSGFLALNFNGRLKFLHGQNRVSEDGKLVPPQLALFAIATPLQQPSILEIRTKTLIFQTKHKLDFTPLGIDGRGKVVLGYNELEICMKGSGYNFIHAADMMHCADNHLKMMKTGETGFTFFRLLTKMGKWVWVQSNARLVFKGGKPDFIVARQRALTNEEGEEQLRLRRLHLPFNFATGEAVLYDTMPSVEVPNPCSPAKKMKVDSDSVSPHSLLGCLLSQDQAVYSDQNTITSLSDLAFQDSHATCTIPRDASAQPAASSPLMTDSTTQDILETLQQILGEAELMQEVEVGPEELKSWESTLLNFTSSEFSDDLNEVLRSDVLSYIEEQLQKEGGDANGELQNQNPGQEPQDFSWTYNQMTFKGEVLMEGHPAAGRGGVKLSHMDSPLIPPSVFNSLQNTSSAPLQCGGGAPVTFNPSQTDLYHQADAPNPKQFPQELPSFCPFPQEGFPVQNQNLVGQLRPALGCHGDLWSSAPGVNISNQPVFPADPSSCMQSSSVARSQNSQNHRQSWLQGAGPQLAASPTHMNPADMRFRTPETLVQQGRMMVSEARPNKASASPAPSKPSCLYQPRPGGGSVPPPMVMQNPHEAVLPCQMVASHTVNGLMEAPQKLLSFTEHNQVSNCPVFSNGGFPFSLLPNRNTCFTENK
ncbi:aryl hydrocarbon receptor isoform X1 [Oryzias melastigma]|uniref:Aryl hydrocarbon receptor n=2 Tax=Oryzias melastigma TaxID=30732 RepID=A0A3B3CLT8_ORYME|nr:aryl hydrocarbon receptor isoform X1 [Oryzias melastigma]